MIARRFVQAFPILAFLSLFLGGCASVERSARLYEHAAVEAQVDPSRGNRVIEGGELVLERSEWSRPGIILLPDMLSGYTLDVVLSQESLVKGNKVDCPSLHCRPHLFTLNAPTYRNLTDVTGTLLVSDVTREGAKIEIDLRSSAAHWALSAEEFYRFALHGCVGMNDTACRFYAK